MHDSMARSAPQARLRVAPAAEQLRRPQLQRLVEVAATCATDTGLDWFRADGEGIASWTARKAELRSACATCPALAACRELALRDRENGGPAREDYMIRAGLDTHELREHLTAEADRLTTAREADRDPDWNRLVHLTTRLRETVLTNPDRSGRTRAQTEAQAGQNATIQRLTSEIAEIRRARRTRQAAATAVPTAGLVDDLEREDNQRGYEGDAVAGQWAA
ncbi:hypothetical protein GCM10010406_41690 [Streptomyces thermolineatus]|uniref:4Fe-4S Wbl-type domain-containing protein n=1 Tax=Streptomyces thermolineatus TaxID=44033 RepID=A0ABP5ZML6_9ACTN